MILGIYGAGGLGREILALARQINQVDNRWQDFIFIDDSAACDKLKDKTVLPFTAVGGRFGISDLEIVIAVGEPAIRRILRERITSSGYRLSTLVHPGVVIPDDTELGEGVIICMNCFISCDVRIGTNVLVQPGVCLGHDNRIGSDTVISPYACIAGSCSIGEETYIGLQAAAKELSHIGNRTIIGMCAAVIRDIPDDVIALGNPARVIKANTEHRVFHRSNQED